MENNIGIKNILENILSALKLKFNPPSPIPPEIIYVGGKMRQGMSATQIAHRIISRQQEAGIPIERLPDGNYNPAMMMEIIRVEEILNALLTEARIDVVIPPGIPIAGVGTGVGVVSVQGATIDFAKGVGIIS